MRTLIAVVVLCVLAGACSSHNAKNESSSAPATSAPLGSAPPHSPRPAVSEGQVNRPLRGIYVYTLTSEKGPALPSGMERDETLTWSGDVASSIIATNKNSNQVTFERKWSSTDAELLTSDAVSSGGERKCAYNPPIKLFPIPLVAGKLPTQHWSDVDLACAGTTDINVIGKDTAKDARGKSWSVWKIQETTDSNGTSVQVHWFSPELGADVRDESMSPAQTTLSVLRDYP